MLCHFAESLEKGKVISIRGRCLKPSDRLIGAVAISMKGWQLHVPWEGRMDHLIGQTCAFLDYRVADLTDLVVTLEPLESSQLLLHSHRSHPQFAVELRCGLGGLSTGAEAAGLKAIAGVDISKWALEVFGLNHSAKCIHGSIESSAVRAQLFAAINSDAVGYMMGFPCPPFSAMGDMAGFRSLDIGAWT